MNTYGFKTENRWFDLGNRSTLQYKAKNSLSKLRKWDFKKWLCEWAAPPALAELSFDCAVEEHTHQRRSTDQRSTHQGGAHKYIHHRGECTQVRVHSCTPGEKAHQEWEAQQDREAHVECTKNGRHTRFICCETYLFVSNVFTCKPHEHFILEGRKRRREDHLKWF